MILCLHDFSDFWYGWRKQLRGLSGNIPSIPPDPPPPEEELNFFEREIYEQFL